MAHSPPPVVTRLVDQTGTAYALAGWPLFEEWAKAHDATFEAVDTYARRAGFTETDRLRVLLYALIVERYERRTR